MGKNGTPFESKRLSNFLSFLKIEEKTKKDMINSCLESNNYKPLSRYMVKIENILFINSKRKFKK